LAVADTQVPVTRTVVTLRDYVRAVVAAWSTISTDPCPKEAPAVLWAQYIAETGGSACWNFNIGNVKWTPGCGLDFMCLRGVWEGVTQAQASSLIAAGEAHADANASHGVAVGAGRVSVVFEPPHPATRFRAYPDLATAMASHLALLAKRFAVAWPAVLAGDVDRFASALHSRGYFTASPLAYAGNMRRPFLDAMTSSAWNDATEAMGQDAIVTVPALPEDTDIVHVDPSLYSLDVDPDDVA
jgi:hypothetical protein